jgi:hypothetical protein
LKTSRDARNYGKTAGIAVPMPQGTTSKETEETRSYDKQFFYGQIPLTFGYPTYFKRKEYFLSKLLGLNL